MIRVLVHFLIVFFFSFYHMMIVNAEWHFHAIGCAGGWGSGVWTYKQTGFCPDGRLQTKDYSEVTVAQLAVAEGMAKISREEKGGGKPAFIANIGDLFYFQGAKNVTDPLFNILWKNVYIQEELQTTWYTVAGNHDWGDSQSNIYQPTVAELASVGLLPGEYTPPNKGNVPAMIAYTYEQQRGEGEKEWYFPDYNYVTPIQEIGNGKTFQMIYIDSQIVAGVNGGAVGNINAENTPNNYTGPLSPMRRDETLAWLEYQLSQCIADHCWVSSHYGLWESTSPDLTYMYNFVYPLLKKYFANILASHDHDLEAWKQVDDEWTVYDIGTGIGGNVNSQTFIYGDRIGNPVSIFHFDQRKAIADGLIVDIDNGLASYPVCWTTNMTAVNYGGFVSFTFDEVADSLYAQYYVTGYENGEVKKKGPKIEFTARCDQVHENLINLKGKRNSMAKKFDKKNAKGVFTSEKKYNAFQKKLKSMKKKYRTMKKDYKNRFPFCFHSHKKNKI